MSEVLSIRSWSSCRMSRIVVGSCINWTWVHRGLECQFGGGAACTEHVAPAPPSVRTLCRPASIQAIKQFREHSSCFHTINVYQTGDSHHSHLDDCCRAPVELCQRRRGKRCRKLRYVSESQHVQHFAVLSVNPAKARLTEQYKGNCGSIDASYCTRLFLLKHVDTRAAALLTAVLTGGRLAAAAPAVASCSADSCCVGASTRASGA